MSRLFLSAAHKSSGKTTVSIGLAAALAARGLAVQTFKKGPDYIDPMWLARASGRPCFNLDFNTQSASEIAAAFAERASGADIALVEGNKGLHDGLDLEGGDSSAALAKLLAAPVVLVIDAAGMMRGVAPLVLGYQAFDAGVMIAGVILNKLGPARQETKLRQALERYTDVPVLGAIGREPDLRVEERHLGLTPPDEAGARDETIARIRRAVANGVDLDRIVRLATAAPALAVPPMAAAPQSRPDVIIAVARDSAFGFYYPDDLAALERAGARIVFFNAFEDARLPEADGLFIGGGFPETQADRLAANKALRNDVAARLRAGLPAYAECGGLMYLTRSIAFGGSVHPMVGFVPADTVMHETPQGRGLVVLEETSDAPWPQAAGGGETRFPAHEFHYASLERLDPGARFAYRVVRGHGVNGRQDGIVQNNLLAGFTHLRDTSRNRWAGRFVEFVRRTKARRAPGRTVEPARAVSRHA